MNIVSHKSKGNPNGRSMCLIVPSRSRILKKTDNVPVSHKKLSRRGCNGAIASYDFARELTFCNILDDLPGFPEISVSRVQIVVTRISVHLINQFL